MCYAPQSAHVARKSGRLGTRCTLLRPGIVDYASALAQQRELAGAVRAGAPQSLIILQHPPTFTLGVRGNEANIIAAESTLASRGATVVRTDRGGDVTFHGPGQVVVYPILDLRRAGLGPAEYVRMLEQCVIDTIKEAGVLGGRIPGRPGVWVNDAKVAAIGVRISGGVSTHGFALNVSTDLSFFDMIVPCGIGDATVTSLERVTGRAVSVKYVEDVLIESLGRRFALEFEEVATPEVLVGR